MNMNNLAKILKKLRIKWNYELTVFELTMADLYLQGYIGFWRPEKSSEPNRNTSKWK